MSTVTIARDVTTEEVADALRHGLAPKYNVLPGVGINWNPVGNVRANHPDSIVVRPGSNRFIRTQVKLSRGPGATTLHVSPGGLTLTSRLTNRLGLDRKVLRVLRDAPSLR
ncbi:MAG: hypothetical protein M3Y09_01775 [Actinomycetota bacterium]|nr:hypothetical protein [Actinomycetota bacterium]